MRPASDLADAVPRYAHGSRVPGWDDAADLTKDPAEVPDPARTEVDPGLRHEVETLMAKYPDRRSAAIPALAAAQRRHGWCSPDAIRQVACVMRLTPGYLDSVASFYDMLDTDHRRAHRVYVCTNISCSLRGADALLERVRAEVGEDPDVEVRGFECLGACDIAPMASVDGVYVGPIALDEVTELVGQIKGSEPPLPAKQLVKRGSADPSVNTQTWPAPGGPIDVGPRMEGDAPGPSAAIEQTQPGPVEGPGQSEDGGSSDA